jgi:cobalt-zinc-cadmium efflux system protein
MHGHSHAHGHAHAHGAQGHHHHGHGSAAGGDPRYLIGIVLNLAFVAVEATAGVLASSTALLADAGHNLSDVLGLALAGGAAWLARQPAGAQRTYGFGKATVLAALANAVALVFACGIIAREAVGHLTDPAPPATGVVMAVAAAGIVVNGFTALLFLKGRHGDANARGAFLHMAADAGVSLGVVIAGALIAFTGAAWLDPLVGLVIVAVILFGTWDLLREAFDLATDAAPRAVDVAAVRSSLMALPGVIAVHDLHVWPLSTTETALTAHIVRPDGGDDGFLREAALMLEHRYRIGHATLQLECEALGPCHELHG